MSYSETINYLYNLQKYGIKFGLTNITRLMSILENPHESFHSIHVAGTNGKGSTSAIIASVLRTSGLKVGLFTSPHLVSFTERIRVDDKEISEDEVISLTEEIKTRIRTTEHRTQNTPSLTLPPRGGGQGWGGDSELNPTFFEVVAAMALLYFKRKRIDIAVIEVGMGGRLDATNVIMPEVSVITSIDYDHREFLGNTLKEIANEKAGIIKDGIPVVISSQAPEVLEVIEAKAEERNTEVYLYGRDFSSVLKREDPSGIYFDYLGGGSFTVHDLYLPLTGEHQMQNASVAIKTVELLSKRLTSHSLLTSPSPTPPVKGGESQGAPLEGEGSPRRVEKLTQRGRGEGYHRFLDMTWYHFIREGLKNVKWPGRIEVIKDKPPVLIDGAHNPAAAVALSNTLVKNFLGRYKRIILVLGIMGDKDIEGIMRPLLPIASEIILTSPDYERAASPERLAAVAASLGFPGVRIVPAVRDALEMAIEIADCGMRNADCKIEIIPNSEFRNPKSLIVVTGSFYTIGEVKEVLGHKGVLSRLRE